MFRIPGWIPGALKIINPLGQGCFNAMTYMEMKRRYIQKERLKEAEDRRKGVMRSWEGRSIGLDSPEAKWINEQIYRNDSILTYGHPDLEMREVKLLGRIRELFGMTEGHEADIYELYGALSDYIADILVQDAVKNNTRDDLPDELLDLYDEAVETEKETEES